MPLTVTAIESSKDKELPGKGTFTSWKLTVTDGTTETAGAELFQRKDSVPPTVGQVIDGTLEQSQFGWKVKKTAKMGGGGGFRPRDPKETAAIQRQHSQEMAVRWTAIAQSRGLLPESFTIQNLKQVIDWFERDISDHAPPYGTNKVKDTVQTGRSDLGDDPSFQHQKAPLEGTPWAA